MFEKSFVSLFFTPRRLQVLKLDSSKNQVDKFMSIDLPKGLIVNYKVQDKKTLVGILQNIWQRLNLQEKSVGIVIPEFSTFTKSLFLPHLEAQDLDEAVRWQAQDFLPLSNKEMVMDWKIVQKQGEDYQILVVAVVRDLLLSFVDTTESAGLFPLVVETPSLSLARITDSRASGKLIIYTNFGETILILASEEKILNSSVVSSSDTNGVLWTAKNMIKHYQKMEVERIEIGGLGFGQELLDGLKSGFNQPLHWIEANIRGLSREQIQEYLVPISLQFKDPAEPLNETTINLLPDRWVKRYQVQRLKLKTWSLMLIISLFIWCCFLASLGVYLVLTREINVLEKQGVSERAELPSKVSKEVQEINQLASKVTKITDVTKSPQEVMNTLFKTKPEGITLSDYRIDLDNGKILVEGQAVDRQVLIEFKQALEAEKDFSKVNIPLSAFEREQNLEFEISFFYVPVMTKKTIKIPI